MIGRVVLMMIGVLANPHLYTLSLRFEMMAYPSAVCIIYSITDVHILHSANIRFAVKLCVVLARNTNIFTRAPLSSKCKTRKTNVFY
jgi:hypothetical protein